MRDSEINRRLDTSSHNTDKQTAPRRKPPALRSDQFHNTPPALQSDWSRSTPPALRSDWSRSTPPALRSDQFRNTPPASHSAADRHLDSANARDRSIGSYKRYPRRLGNYLLTELLGKGGDGCIVSHGYALLSQRNTQKYVVKELLKNHTRNNLKDFQNEIETLKILDRHPNIVHLEDFGQTEDGTHFLVMEYAQGGTLRTIHPKGKRLDLNLIVYYLEQITEALHYMHKKNVIHLDIKPGNILVREPSKPLESKLSICDFGASRVVHNTTAEYGTWGTTAYVAPEYLYDQPTYASDQYSLGIMVYEWLSGSPPFVDDSPEKIREKHKVSPPPSLSKKFPDIPPAIEEVVFKALAKEPEDRYPDIKAFAEAFKQAYSNVKAPAEAFEQAYSNVKAPAEAFEQASYPPSSTALWRFSWRAFTEAFKLARYLYTSATQILFRDSNPHFEERYPTPPIHEKKVTRDDALERAWIDGNALPSIDGPKRLFEKVNPTVLSRDQEENDKQSKPKSILKKPTRQSKQVRFDPSTIVSRETRENLNYPLEKYPQFLS